MSRLVFKFATITALAIASINILAAESVKYGGVDVPAERIDLSNLNFQPRLDCRAHGTPIDLPDDIIVTNEGPGFIRAGTKIRWQMDGGSEGTHVLPALAPRESTYIFKANPGGIPTGRKCDADILRNPGLTPDLTIVR